MTALSKTALQSAIDALFVNNVVGDVEASEVDTFLTNLLDSALGGYGIISTVGASSAQALTTSWATLTKFTANGVSNNCTPDHTTDSVAAGIAGDYAVDIMLQGTGAAGTYFAAPGVGGTESAVYNTQHTAVGAEPFVLVSHSILTLAAADLVTVEMKASGSISYTLVNGILRIKRLS